MRRISSRSCTRTLASSADRGSSSSSTRGSVTRARASATRCCCPPDSSCGNRSARWPSPTSSSAAAARRRGLRPVDSATPQPERDVVDDAQMREQRVRLEDHPDVALVGRDATRRPCPPSRIDAGGGPLESREHAQRGGLAAAGGAEERDELAGGDVQVHAVQHTVRAVVLDDAAELDTRALAGLGEQQVVGRAREGAGGGVWVVMRTAFLAPTRPARPMMSRSTNAKARAIRVKIAAAYASIWLTTHERRLQHLTVQQRRDGELAEHDGDGDEGCRQQARPEVRREHAQHAR